MEKVLITGANGFIGKNLVQVLKLHGYDVIQLVRNKKNIHANTFYWNPSTNELDENCFNQVQHIIHLAGANIGEKRWTKKRKKELWDSRIDSTNLLFEKAKNYPIQTFISASGVSFYGSKTTDKKFTEKDVAGNDFLAKLTVDWEKAADQFESIGARVVKVRTGVVIDKDAEIYHKLLRPIKLGFGAGLGSGKQIFPWISLEDILAVYLYVLQHNNMHGTINGVAPEIVSNQTLTSTIAKSINKKIWLPNVPSFLLKLVLGEMAVIALEGSAVVPQKLLNANFNFKHIHLEKLLDSFKKNEPK